MTSALNRSEQFVYDVCRKSFLSLWSYVNPMGKAKDKELCDILVICDPHVIIISVKECEFKGAEYADDKSDPDCSNNHDKSKPSQPFQVACERWKRKAVEASIKQIQGAVRILNKSEKVFQKDGKPCLPLPPIDRRVYHRIAIAIGGKNYVTLTSEVENDCMVHIWDEETFWHLLRFLNTVTDFTNYLSAKMRFLTSKPRLSLMTEGEEDLLAFFLCQKKAIPEKADFVFIEGGGWKKFLCSPAYKKKVKDDEISYKWDELIELILAHGFDTSNSVYLNGGHYEQVLRTMAKESRENRRLLGKAHLDFLESAKKGIGRARLCFSPSNSGYVFFVYDADSTVEERQNELFCRCLAAIDVFPNAQAVVGVGMNIPGKPPKDGSNIVLTQICIEDPWKAALLEKAKYMRSQKGYFTGAQTHLRP